MDASDIIKALRDKTVYCNIKAQLSIAQARTGAQPEKCGPNNSTIYNFTSYETRNEYFSGRADYGQENPTASTCTTFCFQ